MTDILIEDGRTLLGEDTGQSSVSISQGCISAVGASQGRSAFSLDAGGLLVLPGIVDLHGDAFERQMMPRPHVDFPIDIALIDSDRQAIANGITTVFHATTWSWEPGLRCGDNAQKLLEAIEALRPKLAADTRFHLRHETYNLDAEEQIGEWLADGRIDLFAFNDHTENTVTLLNKPNKRGSMVERTGLSDEAFDRLLESILSRADAVPASIARLAAIARGAGVRMLSHDDNSPEMRKTFRELGVTIAEFPVNEATAREAAAGGDAIVCGAPNVVRGGSHIGWTRASDMIANGLCSVLASDYYYPAPLLAAFRLAADGVLPLARAWDLISAAPAQATGLADRGRLAEGQRADILLVDDREPLRPRIVAVIVAGRLVHLTEAERLTTSHAPQHQALSAE
ncbi:MAG: alpha-D-ribose 1-methylphosphonate 5-triphosphate diphosphatase [Bradyrhizobium sp.]|uniref:alpha-D-ribose 1-methylphosphonate 5-triphosphate diphosphatase n=1 Tax=Bradyrhizobium sp. TaxID=376 RepID=UPI001E1999A9|nr:alpha-D-ribose 1-methylphosphonate 5-triphosphate diphosphatase [Bradyrhizobium sp.]MBV9564682.1 alpha-D-ribose 1-methylphosphonate 5-triphosphate diphosphatase [Bradyrhizobium sp.]